MNSRLSNCVLQQSPSTAANKNTAATFFMRTSKSLALSWVEVREKDWIMPRWKNKRGRILCFRECAPITRHYPALQKKAQFSQGAVAAWLHFAGAADDDVIEQFHLEQLSGPDEIARGADVRLAGRWVAAGMAVLCGAPSYVQPLVGGTDFMAGSSAKGALWNNLILPTGNRTRSFAH